MTDLSDQLINYLTRQILRRSNLRITPDTPLVSSGLIDSFHLVDVLMAIEDLANIEIPPDRVQPIDFETVNHMLSLVQRFKKTGTDSLE